MNRRATRAREYYGYALIAGIPMKEAKRTQPGWIADMYYIRMRYDRQINLGKNLFGALSGKGKKGK